MIMKFHTGRNVSVHSISDYTYNKICELIKRANVSLDSCLYVACSNALNQLNKELSVEYMKNLDKRVQKGEVLTSEELELLFNYKLEGGAKWNSQQ